MISRIELLYMRKLGLRLRQIREQKGYTLEYVINKTGISNLSKIEKGIDTDLQVIFSLCKLYEIDINHIFNEK